MRGIQAAYAQLSGVVDGGSLTRAVSRGFDAWLRQQYVLAVE
jgi:hypothetical protein